MIEAFESIDKFDNSNKNTTAAFTMRSRFAEEKVKEERRKAFPKELLEAHDDGSVYFHDSGFYYMPDNCLLINIEDMFTNGFVLNKILIETPKSFQTACNLVSQIIFSIGGQVYGGKTVSLSHLAPYLKLSHERIMQDYPEDLWEREYKKCLKDGIQTLNYQVQTLEVASDGQSVFCTFFLESNTGDKYINDICSEILRQRIEGVKNPNGTRKAQAFPKLVMTYESDKTPDDLYDLAIDSISVNMYPDILLVKNQMKDHNHQYPCMGCRSWLPDWVDQDNVHQYYGRGNKGVQTINIVKAAIEAEQSKLIGDDCVRQAFLDKIREYANVARQMGLRRCKQYEDIEVQEYPLLFQYGAMMRYPYGTKLKDTKFMYGGYSSISLGYIGLDDLKFFNFAKDDYDKFKLEVITLLNTLCKERDAEDNIGWSVYSTPSEGLCHYAAKKVDWETKTGRTWLTNSYHIDVTEEIDAFNKMKREVPYQYIATGGFISFVELPDMSHNKEAIKTLIKYAEDIGMIYFELNIHLSQCFSCGSKTVEIVDGDRQCLECGEKHKDKLEVCRRTCGYLGTNRWNKGKTDEIEARKLHL